MELLIQAGNEPAKRFPIDRGLTIVHGLSSASRTNLARAIVQSEDEHDDLPAWIRRLRETDLARTIVSFADIEQIASAVTNVDSSDPVTAIAVTTDPVTLPGAEINTIDLRLAAERATNDPNAELAAWNRHVALLESRIDRLDTEAQQPTSDTGQFIVASGRLREATARLAHYEVRARGLRDEWRDLIRRLHEVSRQLPPSADREPSGSDAPARIAPEVISEIETLHARVVDRESRLTRPFRRRAALRQLLAAREAERSVLTRYGYDSYIDFRMSISAPSPQLLAYRQLVIEHERVAGSSDVIVTPTGGSSELASGSPPKPSPESVRDRLEQLRGRLQHEEITLRTAINELLGGDPGLDVEGALDAPGPAHVEWEEARISLTRALDLAGAPAMSDQLVRADAFIEVNREREARRRELDAERASLVSELTMAREAAQLAAFRARSVGVPEATPGSSPTSTSPWLEETDRLPGGPVPTAAPTAPNVQPAQVLAFPDGRLGSVYATVLAGALEQLLIDRAERRAPGAPIVIDDAFARFPYEDLTVAVQLLGELSIRFPVLYLSTDRSVLHAVSNLRYGQTMVIDIPPDIIDPLVSVTARSSTTETATAASSTSPQFTRSGIAVSGAFDELEGTRAERAGGVLHHDPIDATVVELPTPKPAVEPSPAAASTTDVPRTEATAAAPIEATHVPDSVAPITPDAVAPPTGSAGDRVIDLTDAALAAARGKHTNDDTGEAAANVIDLTAYESPRSDPLASHIRPGDVDHGHDGGRCERCYLAGTYPSCQQCRRQTCPWCTVTMRRGDSRRICIDCALVSAGVRRRGRSPSRRR